MNFLSSLNRNFLLEKLTAEHFDLLIIGGGITGAGIALDAASRGIKTALIEKQDFAAGTSSRSTKLIHGGLRYLKNFEFGLVTEVARERKIIFKNAPHLVSREKLLLPLVKNGTFGKFLTRIGLFIYDVLAQVDEWHKILSEQDTIDEEPLLKSDILLGSGFYSEYRTDDARLTLEILKTSAKYGALAANYLEAKSFVYEKNKISGIIYEDILTRKIFSLKAKQVVNAAGPWVDEIRSSDHSLKGKRLHLTKGVHIVVPREKFPMKHSVYFDAVDGRMIFAIPREKITYIGTTDTNYSGQKENPVVTKAEAEYLLNSANRIFPSAQLKISDIISSWAGLRPLIHKDGKTPSELSRKDEIFISERGLISIAGGKLTGYRKMAEKVVNIICNKININAKCKTKQIAISGFEKQIEKYVLEISGKLKSSEKAEYLVRTYGKQCGEILKKFYELNESDSEIRHAKSELWFCVNNESVHKLQDFFVRRTGKILFEPESVKKLLPVILEEMKNYFQWNNDRCEQEKNEIENLMKQSVTFE